MPFLTTTHFIIKTILWNILNTQKLFTIHPFLTKKKKLQIQVPSGKHMKIISTHTRAHPHKIADQLQDAQKGSAKIKCLV